MWSAGQQVGGYEIVAKLREGGMATLFLARQRGSARHVALKVVHPRLAHDAVLRQMFLDEAALASRIDHPNVVRVEELGQFRGAHYLAMEFVHGCSLAQLQRALYARRRRLAPAFAVRIAMQVADALHAAHELRDEHGRSLNVVHRDVTPENILLAYAGHVKLIDFGIAKSYGRRHRTQDGTLKGKFRYMAPEQAHAKGIDKRVDIYQLGIVSWEMLTLRRLFAAEREIDLLASVRRPQVEPPSTLVDRIPPALDAAIMTALDPEPARRFADARSFARALVEAVPAAQDVDAEQLCALLAGTMGEHRQSERTQYPAGVYERLDEQTHVSTQLVAGVRPRAHVEPARRLHATYEYTEQFGSDSSPPRRRHRSERPSERALRGRRPLKLVRFATELRTGLTQMVEANFVGSRPYWILIGSAVGLAAAALLIALALVPARRPVPALPEVTAPRR